MAEFSVTVSSQEEPRANGYELLVSEEEVLTKKLLDAVNMELQRLMLRFKMYSISLNYVNALNRVLPSSRSVVSGILHLMPVSVLL